MQRVKKYIQGDEIIIKNKRIFITGGSGFIGTKIVERLIENNDITVYDTFQRNSLENTGLINHPNLHLIKGDVLNLDDLKNAIKGSEIIIHLAAIAGIDTVIKSPTKTMDVNYIGTSNILKATNELEYVHRFIDFSTSEVYGSYAYKRDESDATSMGAVGEARWTYSISKLAAEHLTHSYYKEFDLPVISIRPFNIYGPGQVGEGAIHNFIKRAINNEDILVHGDGDQIRSWCYVDDIVDGLILCIENEKGIGQVFNIGNPRATITILSLAEKIKNTAQSNSKIIFVPKNYVDVELRIPDIKKSKELLGFAPKIELNEGLKKTIDWYRRNNEFKDKSKITLGCNLSDNLNDIGQMFKN